MSDPLGLRVRLTTATPTKNMKSAPKGETTPTKDAKEMEDVAHQPESNDETKETDAGACEPERKDAKGGRKTAASEGGGSNKTQASEEEGDEVVRLLDGLALGAEASSECRKILILFDFNGTLVHRVKPGDERDPDKMVDHHRGPKPDFSHSVGRGGHLHSSFWLRPGAMHLMMTLLEDPRCEIGLYTSMAKHNMQDIVRAFDSHCQAHWSPTSAGPSSRASAYSSVVDGLIHVWDRPFNIPDPEGGNHWDTMRDLSSIWTSCEHRGMGSFGKADTILIEADEHKARTCLHNTILSPLFGPPQVMRRSGAEEATVLPSLSTYLDRVMERMQCDSSEGADVRQVLRSTPPPQPFRYSPPQY